MTEPVTKSPVGPDLGVGVEAMRVEDWPAVAAIYAEGLATGKATFETEVPEHEHWDATRLQAGRLVARDADGTIVGWAALGRVSRRQFMSGVAEVSTRPRRWQATPQPAH
jgi:phosphinothricin acetyltransferase